MTHPDRIGDVEQLLPNRTADSGNFYNFGEQPPVCLAAHVEPSTGVFSRPYNIRTIYNCRISRMAREVLDSFSCVSRRGFVNVAAG